MLACCKHLRAKKMFIPAPAEKPLPEDEESAGRASHCWCNRTLTETGPDDQPVHSGICRPDRPCFEE